MKKIKRIIAIIIAMIMIGSILTGCSVDEVEVFNAFVKSASIKSLESNTSVTLRLGATGFSKEDNKFLAYVIPLFNNMKIDIAQKMSGNEDKTVTKAQVDSIVEIGGVSTSFGAWIDANLTGEKPVLKEIIRMPVVATLPFPEQFKGKPYMSIDLMNMPELESNSHVDYKKLFGLNKDITAKLIEFMKVYSGQFEPGFKFINYKEGKYVNGEYLKFYEMKLDDKAFKGLVQYSVNDFMKNENAVELIKEFIQSVTNLSNEKVSTEEMFEELKNSIPYGAEAVNKFFDNFKDIKIVGDKGITIVYGINSQGYIVSQSGSINLSIDTKSIEDVTKKLKGRFVPHTSESKGVLDIGIDFNTEISRINTDVQITYPELNDKNSYEYKELYKALNPDVIDFYGYMPYGYSGKPVSIQVDGKILEADVKAQVKDYEVIAPLRSVAEALGAKVYSNQANQTVIVEKDGTEIVFKTNSEQAEVNGEMEYMFVPMTSINKKNYVPVDFIVENLGGEMQWNKKTETLIISTDYTEEN